MSDYYLTMNTSPNTKTLSIISHSEEETIEFGRLLGSLLKKGSVVAITGPLGAGKTYLIKGIAKGLGIKDNRVVTSPTFTLINEYNGRIPIYHFDVYRLTNPNEMYDLGCDEMLWGEGVTVIEWADKVEECLPEDVIRVDILFKGRSERLINISSSGKENEEIVDRLKLAATESTKN